MITFIAEITVFFTLLSIYYNPDILLRLKSIQKQTQLALAWLLKQGDDIAPIPGTKRMHYLEENVKSVDVHLPETAWAELNNILKTFQFQGKRYPASMMAFVDKS